MPRDPSNATFSEINQINEQSRQGSRQIYETASGPIFGVAGGLFIAQQFLSCLQRNGVIGQRRVRIEQDRAEMSLQASLGYSTAVQPNPSPNNREGGSSNLPAGQLQQESSLGLA
jgi:hypothetical protein